MVIRRLPRVAVGMLAFASSARAQVPAQPATPGPPATTAPGSPPPPQPAVPAPAPAATAPAPQPSPPPPAPLTVEPSSVPAPQIPPLHVPPAVAPPPAAVEPARPAHGHPHHPHHPHGECEWHERARPWFGGLGYGSIAPFFGDLGGLEAMLGGPTGLGASYSAPNTGLLIGGGGGSVLFGHLWLGGKGYGLATGGFENTFGKVSVGGGGGAFELGYVLSPNPRVLVIPYFGVGGFSESIEVENVSDVDLIDSTRSLAPDEDGQRVIAKPGQTRTFSASFATLEAGIRLQRLLFHRSSGFSAGFEIGFLSSFMNPAWETDGYEVSNAEGASLEGVYIRLNLGGGGFAYR